MSVKNKRGHYGRARGFAPVPELDFCDLDDFTSGELANLQRKDVPPRESDKPARGQS